MYIFHYFFQAEDGIRYGHVTGVQTCAPPISREAVLAAADGAGDRTVGRLVTACLAAGDAATARELEIGRATCRERGWISVVVVPLKKKNREKRKGKDLRTCG